MSSIGESHREKAEELDSRINRTREQIRNAEATFHFVVGDIVREWSILAYRFSNLVVIETALFIIITFFPIFFYISLAWGFVFISGKLFLIVLGFTLFIIIGYSIIITIADIAHRPPRSVKKGFQDWQLDTDDNEKNGYNKNQSSTVSADREDKNTGRLQTGSTGVGQGLSRFRLFFARFVTTLRRIITKKIYLVQKNY